MTKPKEAEQALGRMTGRLQNASRLADEEQLRLEGLEADRLAALLSADGDRPARLKRLDLAITQSRRDLGTLRGIIAGAEPRVAGYRELEGQVRWLAHELENARSRAEAYRRLVAVFEDLRRIAARLQEISSLFSGMADGLPPSLEGLMNRLTIGNWAPPRSKDHRYETIPGQFDLWLESYETALLPKLERELAEHQARLDDATRGLVAE